ncbi:MAG: hypothetical protein RSK76_09840 [Clostridia bacterium]
MKRKLGLLIFWQLINQYHLREIGEKKVKFALMALLYLLLGGLIAGMATGLAVGLMASRMPELIPTLAVAMTGLMALVFTVLKVKGIVFGFAGFDMLMSLPVTRGQLVASRFFCLSAGEWGLSLLVTAPMAVVYLVGVQPSALAYVAWGIVLLTQTLLPTALGAAIGSALLMISSRFRHANWAAIILSFALLLAYLLGMMKLSMGDEPNVEMLLNLAKALREPIERIYPPAQLAREAIAGGQVGALGLFALIGVLGYALFAVPVARHYVPLNSILTAQGKRGSYVVGAQKRRSAISALYIKEAKKYVASTAYLMNTAFGLVMALAACAVLLFNRELASTLIHVPMVGPLVTGCAPFVVAAMLCTCATSSVALSLEGKSVWLVASLPVTPAQVLRAKALFNMSLTCPTALVCGGMLGIALGGGAELMARLLLVPLSYAIFSAVSGIWVNVKLVKYDWESETMLVKQSVSSFIGIVCGMLLALASMAPLVFGWVDAKVLAYGMSAALLCASALMWLLLGRLARLPA